MSPDGPAGRRRSRLPYCPPNFARLCCRYRGPSRLHCGGTEPDAARPGVGTSFASLRFALPRRSRNLEYNSREKLGRPGAPYSATRSDGPQRLRSWGRDSAPPSSPKSFPRTLPLARSQSSSSLRACRPAQPPAHPTAADSSQEDRHPTLLPLVLRSQSGLQLHWSGVEESLAMK